MNLMATLCQTWSPALFTFYKQNNTKNVKKTGNHVWQSVAVKFISLYVFKSVNFSSHFCATWNFANVKTLLNIILYIWGFGRETVEEYKKKKFFKLTKRTEIFTSFITIIGNFSIWQFLYVIGVLFDSH